MSNKGPISQFVEHHYRHFNAAALVDAAKGYETHLLEGGNDVNNTLPVQVKLRRPPGQRTLDPMKTGCPDNITLSIAINSLMFFIYQIHKKETNIYVRLDPKQEFVSS